MFDSMPLVSFPDVYHVGSFDERERQPASYEGDGLSVSVDPEDWVRIARLSGAMWMLTRVDQEPLRFLDAHQVQNKTREDLRALAAANGWMEQRVVYRMTYLDEETNQKTWIDFDARFEADVEAENYDGAAVTPQFVWRPTATFPQQRVDPKSDPTDLMLVVFTQRMLPSVDGVWWNDAYAPERLSCPRGVLVHPLGQYRATRPSRGL